MEPGGGVHRIAHHAVLGLVADRADHGQAGVHAHAQPQGGPLAMVPLVAGLERHVGGQPLGRGVQRQRDVQRPLDVVLARHGRAE